MVRLLLHEEARHRDCERLLAYLRRVCARSWPCLAEGAGHCDAIAEQLHLSLNTVRTHLQNLMAKLGVHSTLEAVALTRDRADWLPPGAD